MTIEELTQTFLEVAKDAQTLAFLPRDGDLQRRAVEALTATIQRLSSAKAAFVDQNEENAANWTLALEFALMALRSELQMYLDLKEELPESAWSHLINAQEAAAAAIKAHRDAANLNLENYCAKLYALERLVFPPQRFMSVGAIVRIAECSICVEDYNQCTHIKGRPYMGRLCTVIYKEVEVQEVSLVDEPADKRCRVTHFSDGDGRRNKMTWKLEANESATNSASQTTT